MAQAATHIDGLPAMSRSLTVRPPTQNLSDKARRRLQERDLLEAEQLLWDIDAAKMTPAQYQTLLDTFKSVRFEPEELDGLSWAAPPARQLLAKWCKAQVLSLRSGAPSLPAPPSPIVPAPKHNSTLRAPPTARFPPCPPLVPPPSLPGGLQAHLDAAASGLLLPSARRRRVPPHRVFSGGPRRAPAAMARNLTVIRPATVGRCATVRKGDLSAWGGEDEDENEEELRTPRIGVDEDVKAEVAKTGAGTTKTGLTKSAWAKTRELVRSRPRSAMLHPMTRTLSVHPLEVVPTPATPVVC